MPTARSVPLLHRPVFAAVAAPIVAWVGFAVVREPDTPPKPPRLNRNIVASFWSVPVTGGRPRLLLRTRGWQDTFPTYRRDGSILFVRPNSTGQALFVKTAGGAVRQLRALPLFMQLVYSPATDEIVVWRDTALFAESLSGKRRRLLATDNTGGGFWSADGSAFAFARQVRQRTHAELVVVRGHRALFLLDTSTDRRRRFANGSSSYAAWSPDGHTIAYLDEDGLVTRDVRTSRRRVLVPRPRAGWGSFSPDGRSFVYVTQRPR